MDKKANLNVTEVSNTGLKSDGSGFKPGFATYCWHGPEWITNTLWTSVSWKTGVAHNKSHLGSLHAPPANLKSFPKLGEVQKKNKIETKKPTYNQRNS